MKKCFLLLLVIVLGGCAQNIRFNDMETQKRAPNITYEAYFYVEGSNDMSRAVFLKIPDAKVEVVATSPQITALTVTYGDAMAYMNEARSLRQVSSVYVTYMGKPLGYLLTYTDDHSGAPTENKINVELYEYGGKIHFKATEVFEYVH